MDKVLDNFIEKFRDDLDEFLVQVNPQFKNLTLEQIKTLFSELKIKPKTTTFVFFIKTIIKLETYKIFPNKKLKFNILD